MSLPTFDLPRACRFSRVDWDWAAASLSLQQRLLLTFQDQDLPFVSLIITQPSPGPIHPLAQHSSHVQTLRLAETRPHLLSNTYFRLQHCTLPQFLLTLHYTTIPQDLPPGDRSLRRPDKPRPTQSPPPPLVRPDDRRIVYFITAQ
jgi:hypothetical protein